MGPLRPRSPISTERLSILLSREFAERGSRMLRDQTWLSDGNIWCAAVLVPLQVEMGRESLLRHAGETEGWVLELWSMDPAPAHTVEGVHTQSPFEMGTPLHHREVDCLAPSRKQEFPLQLGHLPRTQRAA